MGVWCVAAEFGGWYLVVWPFVGGQRFTLWFGDFVTVGGEFRVFGFRVCFVVLGGFVSCVVCVIVLGLRLWVDLIWWFDLGGVILLVV